MMRKAKVIMGHSFSGPFTLTQAQLALAEEYAINIRLVKNTDSTCVRFEFDDDSYLEHLIVNKFKCCGTCPSKKSCYEARVCDIAMLATT